MADYLRSRAGAQRSIGRAGRPITLELGAVGPADPLRPLAGPGEPPAPVQAVGLFAQPASLQTLGMSTRARELATTCEHIALVAADGVNDLSASRFMTDNDGTKYRVVFAEEFRPGTVAILYFIGVRRP